MEHPPPVWRLPFPNDAEEAGPSRPRKRSQFRPCIDLHGGQVKQIVGGTLDLEKQEPGTELKTNFVATSVSLQPSLP